MFIKHHLTSLLFSLFLLKFIAPYFLKLEPSQQDAGGAGGRAEENALGPDARLIAVWLLKHGPFSRKACVCSGVVQSSSFH
jgi:hypothetical protein